MMNPIAKNSPDTVPERGRSLYTAAWIGCLLKVAVTVLFFTGRFGSYLTALTVTSVPMLLALAFRKSTALACAIGYILVCLLWAGMLLCLLLSLKFRKAGRIALILMTVANATDVILPLFTAAELSARIICAIPSLILLIACIASLTTQFRKAD